MSTVNIFDQWSDWSYRKSVDNLRSNFPEHLKTVEGAKKTFLEQLQLARNSVSNFGGKLDELQNKAQEALTTLREYGERTARGWSAKSGKLDSDVKKALEGYETASKHLQNFLSGSLTDTGIEIPAGLKESYTKFRGATGKVDKLMDGWAGSVRVNNFADTFKRGTEDLKFWEEGADKMLAFKRGAGIAAGGAMVGDAIFRRKKGSEEPRNIVARIIEGGVGVAVATGSVVAGRAL